MRMYMRGDWIHSITKFLAIVQLHAVLLEQLPALSDASQQIPIPPIPTLMSGCLWLPFDYLSKSTFFDIRLLVLSIFPVLPKFEDFLSA